MGKRLLILMLMVGAIALLIAGVAAAAGTFGEGDEPATDPNTVSSDTESTATDPTDAIEPIDTSEVTEAIDPTDTSEVTEADEATESDEVTSTSTTNWGQRISGLRAAGDHTPAAVLKGKKVPGYYKKLTTTTQPVTATDTPPQG